MCDFVPGQVIIDFPDEPGVRDAFGEWLRAEGEEEHVRLVRTMGELLDEVGVPPEARLSTGRQLWLLDVPEGQEHYKVNWLRRQYQEVLLEAAHHSRPELLAFVFDVDVSLNLTLSLCSPVLPVPRLGGQHGIYKARAGLDGGNAGAVTRIAVVDTGCSAELALRVVRFSDFLECRRTVWQERAPQDLLGHGSVVASIIADCVPGCELVICRVAADDSRAITEWHVLAALQSVADVDVVNLSLVFGFDEGACRHCGRQSTSMRSMVFERQLHTLLASWRRPRVVAAAGNRGEPRLMYPARFAEVLAVGSLDSQGQRSSFSNYGAVDPFGDPHPHLFFFGGGQGPAGSAQAESVAEGPGAPGYFAGTSYACAYASAVVARLRGRGVEPGGVLDELRRSARRWPGLEPSAFGNGEGRLE